MPVIEAETGLRSDGQKSPLSRRYTRLGCLVGIVVFLIVVFVKYGGYILISTDPIPASADVAVVLWGSEAPGEARRDEAIRLLELGRVKYVMLSVATINVWGEWLPRMVRRYVIQRYGGQIAEQVILCEMFARSTAVEVVALRECLARHGLRHAIIITSDYHTRRTQMIFRATQEGADTSLTFTIHGVQDADFKAEGWCMERQYAKTWFFEVTKLLWFLIEGVPKSTN